MHAVARAIAQPVADLRAQPGEIDRRCADAGDAPGARDDVDQRLAVHFEQRLRYAVGERAHALAAAGRQNHGDTRALGSLSISGSRRAGGRRGGGLRARPAAPPRNSDRCAGDVTRELRGLGVERGGLARIREHARQILEISRLAVAIEQARENAQHLDVPLQPHEIEPSHELPRHPRRDHARRAAAVRDTRAASR